MGAKKSKFTWRDIKAALQGQNHEDLIKLVGELYSLNKDNKHFLESRIDQTAGRLEPYKQIIDDAVYPDIYSNRPIQIAVAKKAISNYKKSRPDDLLGHLELMVFFVERANSYTVDFGDINEGFYTSVETMFEKASELIKQADPNVHDEYIPRLEQVVNDAHGIGWGYFDGLASMLNELYASVDWDEDKIQFH
ncbi:hypothetical protein Mmc1_1123 [Magnetococcus marinus MC-1]|uniref:Uncharacterized protein n=1 Tax=Magnetococcus marinus (strain ATCC BAA-1437 / JCM 17883 / MC-1) TaxID=156889 RepID=A0L6P5_MAGMM|nr:hypothetical protein [Magnetococcus marinus]ABK43638.1 hypothetical protein Mmc1_1123 [Magnetococcus marinus MC-1]